MFDIEAFRRIVESAAFHRQLGVRLDRADPAAGVVVLRQPYDPKLSIFPEPGTYHGGVLAALVDIAGSVACGLQVGRPTPTVNFRVDYLKSAVKVDLVATGRVVRAGKSIAVADVEVSDDAGEVYAVGRGTFSMSAALRAVEAGAGRAGVSNGN